MYWMALTLGFLGSLHCVGMCGPLALAIQSTRNKTGWASLLSSVTYNSGRTLGYMALGLIFGVLGSFLAMAGLQKTLSIGLGVVLILVFLFTSSPDQWIGKVPVFQKFYTFIQLKLMGLLKKTQRVPTIFLGMMNGFLPCGLVYVGLAGAISLSHVWGSMGFMMFFGLGTFPAMVLVMVGPQAFSQKMRVSLRKLYPIITLIMGIYLIYRGVMSKYPLELNFLEAINNPVMCH